MCIATAAANVIGQLAIRFPPFITPALSARQAHPLSFIRPPAATPQHEPRYEHSRVHLVTEFTPKNNQKIHNEKVG